MRRHKRPISEQVRRFEGLDLLPYPDESLLGFVTRCLSFTAVRQLRKGLLLGGAARSEPVHVTTTLTDEEQIASLAHVLCCEPEDISSRVYRAGTFERSDSDTLSFFGTMVRSHYFETKIRRVSPRALDIEPYHRAIWQLRPFAFDPSTRELLLDTCPVCGRKLGWRRAQGVMMCDRCVDEDGMPLVDLRDWPQPLVEVEDDAALTFVTDLVNPVGERRVIARRSLPSAWQAFSNADLFETVVALASGLTLDPGVTSLNAQGRSKRTDQFVMLKPEFLAAAGRAIIGGEEGFGTLCELYRIGMEKRPRKYGRRKELGPLAYFAYDHHLNPDIRTLLSWFIDLNMMATIRVKHEPRVRKGQDADPAVSSIQKLSKGLGVDRRRLQRFAESGLVPVVRSNDGRSPVRMDPASVIGPAIQMKDAATDTVAAGIIGLPRNVLKSLADNGLIRRLEGPVCGFMRHGSGYVKSSITVLMERVWSHAKPVTKEKVVSIGRAAREISHGEAPWAAILAAIVAGDVEVFRKNTGRPNIRYMLAVRDINGFVAGVRKHLQSQERSSSSSEWIGHATAAEILQVNEILLWRVVKADKSILKAENNGYTPYRRSTVEQVARTYVFVSEITARTGMHGRSACTWLRQEGVVPCFSARANRDHVFFRAQVEPLLASFCSRLNAQAAVLPINPEDLRVRLIKAISNGAEIKATALRLGVGYRQAVRWVAKWRRDGSVAPDKFGVKSPLDKHVDWIRTIIDSQPDISLGMLQQLLQAHCGIRRSRTAIWNVLERHGIVLDNNRRHLPAA